MSQKHYDDLTLRGKVRRLRGVVKQLLPEFNVQIKDLKVIKHLKNTTFRLWAVHVADRDPKGVEVQWEVFVKPLLNASLDQFPS